MPASVIALPGCLRFRNFCARPLVLLMASFPLVDPDAGGLAFDLNSEALILNTYNNTMKKVKQIELMINTENLSSLVSVSR